MPLEPGWKACVVSDAVVSEPVSAQFSLLSALNRKFHHFLARRSVFLCLLAAGQAAFTELKKAAHRYCAPACRVSIPNTPIAMKSRVNGPTVPISPEANAGFVNVSTRPVRASEYMVAAVSIRKQC